MAKVFDGNFTRHEPLPTEVVPRAIGVMNSGRLHRHIVAPGEVSETALLKQEFGAYMGAKYCLAVTSGDYALTTALRAAACGMTNRCSRTFTLAPVPGAIAGAGGRPILVETIRDFVIGGDDLAEKISFSGAKI
jgi:dTDP-4-amino-4,6-dideoxygalactose transaminase